MVDLSKIHLDSENPRIPKSLHSEDEKNILKYMVNNASIIELINSIGENGYFAGEPIILIKKNAKYKVVEGNRRVSALKLMQNPTLAKEFSRKLVKAINQAEYKPTKIPSFIVEDEKEVHKFLGFRHITGIKNWNALEKARYLYYLKENLLEEKKGLEDKQIYYELAKSIGSRSDYVKRVLIAYELYLYVEEHNFLNIRGLNDTTFYFTNLSDALNRTNIAKFLGVNFENAKPLSTLNVHSLSEFVHWLYEKNDQLQTRIKGTSTHFSKLNEILSSEKALVAFRDGKTLDEALFLTKEVENIFNDSISKVRYYLKEADSVVHKLDKFYETFDSDLNEITQLIDKIKLMKLMKINRSS